MFAHDIEHGILAARFLEDAVVGAQHEKREQVFDHQGVARHAAVRAVLARFGDPAA